MAVGGKSGLNADINMTPMIDVLLVLIIIFMVITPLTPKGLEARVPQPPPPNQPPPPPDQDRTVVIIVEADKKMKINQEDVLFENLGKRLEDIFKTRAERVCFVKGDPGLEYQDVAKVIDVAKGVGIDQVGLMTKKVEEGN
ncbi:MAG: protein TolR [Bryobacter sp.]